MHLRVANLVKFKLDETRQAKFRSLQLKKRIRCISPRQQNRLILDIENKVSKFPMIFPKQNLRTNNMQIENESFNNK